jgi:hypothetical protein
VCLVAQEEGGSSRSVAVGIGGDDDASTVERYSPLVSVSTSGSAASQSGFVS